MSKRVVELFLFDIYIAIIKIEKVVSYFSTAEELLHNFTSWDSVIREFEIIGEATNQLIKANILDDGNRVVVDFRNLLIHHYFGVDPCEVWNVVEDNIPDYKSVILEKINAIDCTLKADIISSLSIEFSYIDFVVENINKLR